MSGVKEENVLKIAVVSDSHGNLYSLDKALSELGEFDMIVHLGDHFNDIVKVNEKYKKPIEYICGNNDYGKDVKYEKVIEVNGKRLLLVHGHRYDVYYNILKLYLKALEENVDVVLFGHTHVQKVDREGEVLFLNPGSTSRPRDGMPGAALLEIKDDGEVEVRTIRFNIE